MLTNGTTYTTLSQIIVLQRNHYWPVSIFQATKRVWASSVLRVFLHIPHGSFTGGIADGCSSSYCEQGTGRFTLWCICDYLLYRGRFLFHKIILETTFEHGGRVAELRCERMWVRFPGQMSFVHRVEGLLPPRRPVCGHHWRTFIPVISYELNNLLTVPMNCCIIPYTTLNMHFYECCS